MINTLKLSTNTYGGTSYLRRIVRQVPNGSVVNVILLCGNYQLNIAKAIIKQVKELELIGATINYTLFIESPDGELHEYIK